MNFRYTYLIFSFVLILSSCHSQSSDIQYCQDKTFNAHVAKYIDFEIPVISVQSLIESKGDYIILDARERDEYNTSHIPNALYVGYKNPDFDILKRVDSSSDIVVYCSIGYRSEKIGLRLQEMGYKNVSNLYGSIFEWANQGHPLVDKNEQPTNDIHGYNKKWSKWISNKNLEVTY